MKNVIGNGLLQLISALVMLIGTIVIMFLMNWLLALIIFALVPMILVILFLFVSRVMPVSQKVQKELGALNTILQENLAGMHVVKAFATENFELEQYRRKNENLLDINLDLVAIFSKYFPLIGLYLLGNFNDA